MKKKALINYHSNEYTYETKCRRCGNMSDWVMDTHDAYNDSEFIEFIHQISQYIRTYYCEECHGDTIQDVVSYNLL